MGAAELLPPGRWESISRARQNCTWKAQQKAVSPVWGAGPGAEITLLPLSSFLEAGLGCTAVSNLVEDRDMKPEPEQHNLPLVLHLPSFQNSERKFLPTEQQPLWQRMGQTCRSQPPLTCGESRLALSSACPSGQDRNTWTILGPHRPKGPFACRPAQNRGPG